MTVQTSTEPSSSHVSDPALQPFLQPTFDPADYLNATLPSLSPSSVSSRPLKQGTAASLAELSSQTNDLLSQLNAHTTRLSTILTQLTGDILRSGGRLVYEVEVLRGETIGLTDTLTETLKPDVEKFLPSGISLSEPEASNGETEPFPSLEDADEEKPTPENGESAPQEASPEHITHLRTLTLVRARLESVIKIFGEAMHWVLPPSETSSSLISVSAPSGDTDATTLEQRGQQFASSLRSEISDLITGSENTTEGVDAARERIAALKDLAQLWKGTVEEKARTKFVEGLVKLAEEKQREKENAWSQRQAASRPTRSGSVRKDRDKERESSPQKSEHRAARGFLDNLQKLRGNIYLE